MKYKRQSYLLLNLILRGARLGDTQKPNVCIYYGKNGLIIDNKAYSKGYSLPMSQADYTIGKLKVADNDYDMEVLDKE